MPIASGFDPASYNSTSGTGFTLGQELDIGDGRIYRFFKLADAVDGVNGMVAEWASTTDTGLVTVDRVGGSSLGRFPACVLVGGVTHGRYFFGQVLGRHSAIKDAANAALVGIKQKPHATVDGDAAPATAYTDHWFCVALASASGGSFPAEVRI